MIQIGTIHTDFPEKFGIPRQPGLVADLPGYITFEPEFRQPEAFKGIEDFEYLWLLWGFHKAKYSHFSATVKPPKLGGNINKGVFATRSPFRPNSIGLSSVRLKSIEYSEKYGIILHVLGADMVDGTPIYDIKPYLPYTDCHPAARAGFTESIEDYKLEVIIPDNIVADFPTQKLPLLKGLLSEDPRPGYKTEDESEFGLSYAGYNIRFKVSNKVLEVTEIRRQFPTV